jgi:hypothetical protein
MRACSTVPHALLLCCISSFIFPADRQSFRVIVTLRPMQSVPLRHLAECVSASAKSFHITCLRFIGSIGRFMRRDNVVQPQSVILLQHRMVFEIEGNGGMGE